MIVYRFERNGIGPFIGGTGPIRVRGGNKRNKYVEIKTRHIRNKYGRNMKKAYEAHKPGHVFGCPSKEALRAYFGYNFKSLFRSGYRIKTYEVPDSVVINAGIELSFPVEYHKLRTRHNMEKTIDKVHKKVVI